MNEMELISKIRLAVESDEDKIVRVINVQFLLDEYDRSQSEVCV